MEMFSLLLYLLFFLLTLHIIHVAWFADVTHHVSASESVAHESIILINRVLIISHSTAIQPRDYRLSTKATIHLVVTTLSVFSFENAALH